MADAKPKLETTPEEKEAGFDVDKALNTKGFAEFLASHKGSKKIEDMEPDVIEAQMEVFLTKEAVKEDIKKVYAGEMREKLGIDLEASDMQSVDAYIDELALEDPDQVMDLKDQITLVNEFPSHIKTLEDQLAPLGVSADLNSQLENLRGKREAVSTVRKNMTITGILSMIGDVGMARETYEAGKKVSAQGVSPFHRGDLNVAGAQLDKNIEATEATLATVTNLTEMKGKAEQMYGEIRKGLLGGMAGYAEVAKAVKKKALTDFASMANVGTLEALLAAQDRLNELKEFSESSETGVDIFDALSPEQYQAKLDTAIEKKAFEEVMESIMHIQLGDHSLDRLERALLDFTGKESFGSKEGDDAKTFVRKTIQEARDGLGDSVEDKAKKLLLARILAKLKK